MVIDWAHRYVSPPSAKEFLRQRVQILRPDGTEIEGVLYLDTEVGYVRYVNRKEGKTQLDEKKSYLLTYSEIVPGIKVYIANESSSDKT